mgnify:CR=1 FL=1
MIPFGFTPFLYHSLKFFQILYSNFLKFTYISSSPAKCFLSSLIRVASLGCVLMISGTEPDPPADDLLPECDGHIRIITSHRHKNKPYSQPRFHVCVRMEASHRIVLQDHRLYSRLSVWRRTFH